MLLYRTNRVPDRHRVTFLKLLNGPDWKPSKDLAEDVRTTILGLRRTWRAVTKEDYETLALSEAAPGQVARVLCLPQRDLSPASEADKLVPRPGHISVILVPPAEEDEPAPAPTKELCQAVWTFLNERRLLTTRHHVVGPQYVSVQVRVTVVRDHTVADTNEAKKALSQEVAKALCAFLDPLKGGIAKKGWPFGGAVYKSDLYPVLQAVSGVASIKEVVVLGDEKTKALLYDPSKPIDASNLIGLALKPHHLPQVTEGDITVTVDAPDANTEGQSQ